MEGTSAEHGRVLILCEANAPDLWIGLFTANEYKAIQPWRRCSDHARVALGTGVVTDI